MSGVPSIRSHSLYLMTKADRVFCLFLGLLLFCLKNVISLSLLTGLFYFTIKTKEVVEMSVLSFLLMAGIDFDLAVTISEAFV